MTREEMEARRMALMEAVKVSGGKGDGSVLAAAEKFYEFLTARESVVTPLCCDAHAQGAAVAERCSNARDAKPKEHVWKFYAPHKVWICQTCGLPHDPARVAGNCSGKPTYGLDGSTVAGGVPPAERAPTTHRGKVGQASMDGVNRFDVKPGQIIECDDPQHVVFRNDETQTGLIVKCMYCRHCRCLFLPR